MQWLQLCWEAKWDVDSLSIVFKELVPVIIAAIIWGRQWRGLVVQCRSDNKATVAVINNCISCDAAMMHLLRCLAFFEAAGEFCLTSGYIPGPQNDLADDISRGRLFPVKDPMGSPGSRSNTSINPGNAIGFSSVHTENLYDRNTQVH